MDRDEDDIRSLAHEMWMKAGSPEGNELGFWLAAEATLVERERREASRNPTKATRPFELSARR